MRISAYSYGYGYGFGNIAGEITWSAFIPVGSTAFITSDSLTFMVKD